MRRLFASLVFLLPLVAVGQTVGAGPLDQTPATQLDGGSANVWAEGNALTEFRGLGMPPANTQGGHYVFGPRVRAHFSVSDQAWPGARNNCNSARLDISTVGCNRALPMSSHVVDSELGATFKGNGYSLGVGVSSSKPTVTLSPLLPRIVPNASFTSDGVPLSALDHSDRLNANGRVALGNQTGIDLGASVGRIRLLPGNLLGVDTLGQKSLSVGVDRGDLSGHIIGRVIQPQTGESGALAGDRRWTTIDLGVTWRLPWRGELSFGAQNLWSSGEAPKPKVGPDPDQSRIPYVQYHQDL